MILVKLLGFAMLIGTVMGSVVGIQIVIDRLVAAQRRNCIIQQFVTKVFQFLPNRCIM